MTNLGLGRRDKFFVSEREPAKSRIQNSNWRSKSETIGLAESVTARSDTPVFGRATYKFRHQHVKLHAPDFTDHGVRSSLAMSSDS